MEFMTKKVHALSICGRMKETEEIENKHSIMGERDDASGRCR